MTFFSIVLLTYNRNTLLKNAVNSILSQSFGDFELLIYNNGSKDGTREYLDSIGDKRVKVFHYDENSREPDIDRMIRKCSGQYVLPFLADDDLFAPEALGQIAKVFNADSELDFILAGSTWYNYDTNTVGVPCLNQMHDFVSSFDAVLQLKRILAHWGIGPEIDCVSPAMAHPSCCFYRRDIVKKATDQQGQLFLPPFGDIGLLGCWLHSKKAVRLDLPLVILGSHSQQDGSGLFQRHKFEVLRRFLENSPLKVLSFATLSIEGHLRVAVLNNLLMSVKLRPKFFLYHLYLIIKDRPWTKQTILDIFRSIPATVVSLLLYGIPTLLNIRKLIYSRKNASKSSVLDKHTFTDLEQYLLYLGANYTKSVE